MPFRDLRSDYPPEPDAVRAANARWLASVVRPAFELFAVGTHVRAFGPMVFSGGNKWCVEIVSPRGQTQAFSACVGYEEAEGYRLAAEITGNPHPFGRARPESLDIATIVGALTLAFRRWNGVQG